MNYRILDPASIISWILSPEILEKYHSRYFLWTIMRGTVKKILLKTDQLKSKIEISKASEDTMKDGT